MDEAVGSVFGWPRCRLCMFLNLYETTYMEHALACTEAGMRPFPALVLFMTSISYVSLAINRSVVPLIWGS